MSIQLWQNEASSILDISKNPLSNLFEAQLQATWILNPILLYSSCTLNNFQQTKTYRLHIHMSISSIFLSCFIWYLIAKSFSWPSRRPVRTLKLILTFILRDFASYRLNMANWIHLLRLYFQNYISKFFFLQYSI